jgi:hypothetical protein
VPVNFRPWARLYIQVVLLGRCIGGGNVQFALRLRVIHLSIVALGFALRRTAIQTGFAEQPRRFLRSGGCGFLLGQDFRRGALRLRRLLLRQPVVLGNGFARKDDRLVSRRRAVLARIAAAFAPR